MILRGSQVPEFLSTGVLRVHTSLTQDITVLNSTLSFLWNSFEPLQISFVSLVKNCNHKGLGIYYLLSAFIFGISGTLISVCLRINDSGLVWKVKTQEAENFYEEVKS